MPADVRFDIIMTSMTFLYHKKLHFFEQYKVFEPAEVLPGDFSDRCRHMPRKRSWPPAAFFEESEK